MISFNLSFSPNLGSLVPNRQKTEWSVSDTVVKTEILSVPSGYQAMILLSLMTELPYSR